MADCFERKVFDGRSALVVYLDDKFTPQPKDKATMCKIIYDDGDQAFEALKMADHLPT